MQGFYQFFLRQGPEGFIVYGRFLRAFGTFGQPNPYGAFLALIIPIAFAILLVGLTGRTTASEVFRNPVKWLLSAAGCDRSGVHRTLRSAGHVPRETPGLPPGSPFLRSWHFVAASTFLILLVLVAVGLVVALFGALDLLPPVLVERIGGASATISGSLTSMKLSLRLRTGRSSNAL